MKLALYTISISPHITSYWKRFQVLWDGEVGYFYKTAKHDPEREKIGWQEEVVKGATFVDDSTYPRLEDVDILIETMRDVYLIERRLQKGLLTIYSAERWFKPPLGFLRVFVPSYFKMGRCFVKCLASPQMYLMPQGIHAARDMARLFGFMRGDVRTLFGAPKVAFESKPGGMIVPLKEAIQAGVLSREEIAFAKRYGFVQIPREHWGKVKPQGMYAKMRLWGYFVDPNHEIHEKARKVPAAQDCQCEDKPQKTQKAQKSFSGTAEEAGSIHNSSFVIHNSERAPRVLWVGRMLKLKRVKDLIKACGDKILLSLYGKGPEEENLKTLAKGKENITFNDFVPMCEVRNLMRRHDVYIFSSDAHDGWGAVVSEALEEGMMVIGTVDAGSSATILPPTHLYKAGDVKRLTSLLSQPIEPVGIGEWSAENAARALKAFLLEILDGEGK